MKSIDVFAIGQGIYNEIIPVPEKTLAELAAAYDFPIGGMKAVEALPVLTDKEYVRAGILHSPLDNTAISASHMGAKTYLAAQVATDNYGTLFSEAMKQYGVAFDTPPIAGETHHNMVLINRDNPKDSTYLVLPGVSSALQKLDHAKLAQSRMLVLDASSFDAGPIRTSAKDAVAFARNEHIKIAFGLNRKERVEKHKSDILDFMQQQHPDIVFGNQQEFETLFGTSAQKEIIQKLRAQKIPTTIITRGDKGALIVTSNRTIEIPPAKGAAVVDTTGAGDSFMGGFLAAYSKGMDLKTCGKWGAYAARRVIERFGMDTDWNNTPVKSMQPDPEEKKLGLG